jgi:RimJ/RimL family protein N-acetyltransferase
MSLAGLKIISGGQSGADRAALDWAIEHGIPHGGWCPRGRMAEDGLIAARYVLTETPEADYNQRTDWNVRDADATAVFSIAGELKGGSKRAAELARSYSKPLLHLSRQGGATSPGRALLDFIEGNRIQVLNVAGPRASEEPEVGEFVRTVLSAAWDTARDRPTRPTTLTTQRLVLRPLTLDDAPAVTRLAGRREIADTTLSIPHPLSEPQAREWIAKHGHPENAGKEIVFGITMKEQDQLIGAVGLRDIDPAHLQVELGFWVAVEHWGQGYATEAVQALLRFAFEHLGLNRVHAHHMVRNPASGRVLQKVGMKQEGLLRQRVRKWGVFEDVVVCAILSGEWSGR